MLDGNRCTGEAWQLADKLATGCQVAGMRSIPFGVPGGTAAATEEESGNATLPFRNAIANAAEMVAAAQGLDALVGLHLDDSHGPGFAMALARLNCPGLILSGGAPVPERGKGQAPPVFGAEDQRTPPDMGSAVVAANAGICPADAFHTWAIVLEALGLALPNSASLPTVDPAKQKECLRVGSVVRQLLARDIRPRDILTKAAFTNAMTVLAALGGSTNGVLHLLALAREAGVEFNLREVQEICRRTPLCCHFAPRGRGTMADLHRLGGTSMLLKHFWIAGLLDDTCLTLTGLRLGEVLFDAPELPPHQNLITGPDRPFDSQADIQACFGNLAPDGILFKAPGMNPVRFQGTALCFSDAQAVEDAAAARKIKPGHVVVLRHLGPVAAGMPEVLRAAEVVAAPELAGKAALISDARVSGISQGIIGVHCAPEAVIGGPIGLVQDGDAISFDLAAGDISWHVSEREISIRRTNQRRTAVRHDRTYLADFAATVCQANTGCVSRHVLR